MQLSDIKNIIRVLCGRLTIQEKYAELVGEFNRVADEMDNLISEATADVTRLGVDIARKEAEQQAAIDLRNKAQTVHDNFKNLLGE